jgi:hypothetical protein
VRRIILTIASTAAALVLLFSYRTSTGSGDVAAKTIISSGAGVVSGATTAPSAAVQPPSASQPQAARNRR